MDPTGDKYVDFLHQKGTSVKPGDRVVVTDIKINEKSIELDLNGGFEHKHKFLRHVSIGMDPVNTVPLAADNGQPMTGSRLTLVFEERVPDLNGEQLQALLKPMIDFGVKSPAEAFAETLPPFLRNAIEQHRVLVGMNRDMVVYAKGQPTRKVRETSEDGKLYEIWIYGETPQPVEFVRFDGSFVAEVKLASVGAPMVVRNQNEMGDYWGNQPVVATNQRQVKLGDQTDADRSAENAQRQAPTLRKPGEQLPRGQRQEQPRRRHGPGEHASRSAKAWRSRLSPHGFGAAAAGKWDGLSPSRRRRQRKRKAATAMGTATETAPETARSHRRATLRSRRPATRIPIRDLIPSTNRNSAEFLVYTKGRPRIRSAPNRLAHHPPGLTSPQHG
jgi:hypothetical protein